MSDQEVNLKFVGEVEKHEELYNYKLPGYSRKDVTEKAWQQVALEMNMSVAECKEKWRNLRTVFMRKMKPPPSGSGAKKKAYYLETAMQFCLPFIKTLAPPSSGNLPSVPLPSTDDDGVIENTEISSASDSIMDISPPVQSSQASLTQLSSSANTQLKSPAFPQYSSSEQQKNDSLQFSSSTGAKRKFTSKNKSAAAVADQSVAEYFKAKKIKIQQIEEATNQKIDRNEGLKMFLLSMLPELQELSDSQIKVFKRRFLALIDEISSPSQDHHQFRLPPMISPQSDSSSTQSQNQHRMPIYHSMLSPQSSSSYMSERSHETQMSHVANTTQYYNNFSQSVLNLDN